MAPDPLEEIERALAAQEEVPTPLLSALTLLEGDNLRRFQRAWRELDGSARTELLDRLVEEGDENLALDFTAVYQLGLDDPNPSVRARAYTLAAQEADDRLLDMYLRAAESDPDDEARVAAVDSLGAFTLAAQIEDWPATTQERLQQTLRAILHHPKTELRLRRAALLSLSYLTTPQVETEIRQAHLQPDLRAAAILAMGRNCQAMWLQDLRDEMIAQGSELRLAAVEAAAELEDEQLVPDLINRVDDEEPDIQEAAVRALGIIGGRQAKAALSELLHAKDRSLRVAAREALAEMIEDDPLAGLSESQ